jgi:hypothetical protein
MKDIPSFFQLRLCKKWARKKAERLRKTRSGRKSLGNKTRVTGNSLQDNPLLGVWSRSCFLEAPTFWISRLITKKIESNKNLLFSKKYFLK